MRGRLGRMFGRSGGGGGSRRRRSGRSGGSRSSRGSRRGGVIGGLGALELVIGAVAILIVVVFLLQLID